jgi:RNA polymerase sigma-70 factor, ECF subfamily
MFFFKRYSHGSVTSGPSAKGEEAEHWPARIRAGDEAAFEAMFRTYYEPLCAFVNGYLRSLAIAEEVVQDVFYQLWKNREKWQVNDSVRAYLFGAARNQALDRLKHQRVVDRWREQALREADISGPASPATPDRELENRELGAAIDAAMESLPERARLAATLRWRHQLSYAEIAEVMGITTKGVENQLGRVAKTLRATLAAFRP